jgi:signal transduction histidine kinase/ActR/RegA family two-component response regulator
VCSYLAVPVTLGNGDVIGGLFFGHEATDRFTESHERLVETLAAQAAIGLNKASLYQEALFARQRAEQDALEKQKLYEEAARANEAKDQFLATVSHELRTPLTSILGWAQMLTSGKLDASMKERAIATIERNARSQAQIVEDLLDISRIVNGKLRLNVQLFSPQVSVDAALEALRPAAHAKNIALQLVADPSAGPISGDPERLQQIIWNLLSNAVKFTPKGGRVQLTLKKVDSNVQLVISDNGAGIPVEHLCRIFDTFTQIDPTSTRKHGGLGLGLAIVKKLVELHGGSVHASSPGLGQGSAFTVTLPLAAVRSNRHEQVHDSASSDQIAMPENVEEFGLRGATILLVEDDDDARNMLASVLMSANATVETAANAQEALTLYEGIRPDLIVSDIGMPEMYGYEFISELRRREQDTGRASTPAVALTAYARVQDRMRALTCGFQMHVAKPVEPAELLTVLSSLLSWNLSA